MPDLNIEIHDKTLHRVGWVNDPTSLTVTAVHNGIGSAELVVPSDHHRVPLLRAKGARLVIDYRGERLMSGYIRNRSGVFGPDGTMTFPVQDDLWLLERMLGWPAPTAAINAQGVKQDTRTGPAETVAKGFVAGVLAHNTVDPITVAPDLGRGSTITASSRMKQLSEVLLTACDLAGIGLKATQQGGDVGQGRIVFDAYVPKVFPRKLSRAARTILTASWSEGDPTMTRAIAGGPLADTSREFGQVIGAVGAARETDLGYTIEGFVDAQSAESSTARDAQGTTALAAAGPTAGYSVTLSESGAFLYGGPNGVHRGDMITITEGGADYADVLRQAKLTFDRETGLTLEPVIGDHSDDPSRTLTQFLGSAYSAIRDLRTR